MLRSRVQLARLIGVFAVSGAIGCGRVVEETPPGPSLAAEHPASSSSSSAASPPALPPASSAPPSVEQDPPPPSGPVDPVTCTLPTVVPPALCATGFCWQNPLPQGADIDAACADGTDLWAVAGRTLLHFDGQTWSAGIAADKDALRSIALDSATKTLYLGNDRTLFSQPASVGGDVIRTPIPLPTDAPPYGEIDTLWYDGDGGLYVDVKPGWMEGTTDVPFHRYDTRKGTWTSIATKGRFVRGITGSGPKDVWAVGTGGLIIHWDGVTWTEVDSGVTPVTQPQFKGVAKVGDTLIVVGSEGTEFAPGAAIIMELGRGGWKRHPPFSSSFSLLSNIAVLGDRVFVAGGSDLYELHRRRILERDPKTKQWSEVCLSPDAPPLRAIVTFGSTVWAFGERGAMFSRDASGAWTKAFDEKKFETIGTLAGDPQRPSELLVRKLQGALYRWTPNGLVSDFNGGAFVPTIVARTDVALWACTDRVLTRVQGKWTEVAFPYPPPGKQSWLAAASNAGDLVVVERASTAWNVPPPEDCTFHYKHEGAWSTLPLTKCASSAWLAPNGDVWAFGSVPGCATPCKLENGQWTSHATAFTDETGAAVSVRSPMQRGAGPLFLLGEVGPGPSKKGYVFSFAGGAWSRTQAGPFYAFDATDSDAWGIDIHGVVHRNATTGSWDRVRTPMWSTHLVAAPDGHLWLAAQDGRLMKSE